MYLGFKEDSVLSEVERNILIEMLIRVKDIKFVHDEERGEINAILTEEY